MKKRKGTSVQFQCSHCSKQFKYDSDRKRHEMSHSSQFKCGNCSKKFNFMSALRRHQKQHQRTGSVECSDCGKMFKDETLLKRHIQYAHNGTHVCPECKTTFSSELALGIHMKTHNLKSQRKYVCGTKGCGKSFNFPHHLKHHELTHTNIKQYFCSVCEKGFIQSHHLKTHMKTHDPDKSLYCPIKGCTKKFSTEYSRKRHLTIHKKQESRNRVTDAVSDNSLPKDFINETKTYDKVCNEEIIDGIFNPSIKPREEPETKAVPTTEIEYEVTSCKTALGQCIMDGESDCLCAQISNSNVKYIPDERLNEASIEINVVPSHADITHSEGNMQKGNGNTDACEGCECGNYKKVVELRNICPNADKAPAVLPDIEYSIDGVVKLKDTIDEDIAENCNDDVNNVNVPYFSCKAVLGNCIVGGNGTVDEGCLCAKMFADEQVMEQEIEDITPRPNFGISL